MSSPHVYKFPIDQDIFSVGQFLFSEFNPISTTCFCIQDSSDWTTEYLNRNLPLPLVNIRNYVYYQMSMAGFMIKNSCRMILYEYNSKLDHSALSKGMFYTSDPPRVNAILTFTKRGVYDSGLIYKKRVYLSHPHMKNFSMEEEVKTSIDEGMGVMYHKDNFMEFVGGTGVLQMICLSFDQK